jgi:hypothetical protein
MRQVRQATPQLETLESVEAPNVLFNAISGGGIYP